MLRVLDCFGGIGGFSLGLDLVGGFQTVGICEIDHFCRAALRRNFPDAWQWDDITTLCGDRVLQHCGRIDVVTAGVPCQPASVAGSMKGVNDERWLWPSFLRILRELRPVWVLAENVRGFVNLKPCGLNWLLGELEAIGYQSLALLISAGDLGAPHRRQRLWVMAHAGSEQRKELGRFGGSLRGEGTPPELASRAASSTAVGHADLRHGGPRGQQRDHERSERSGDQSGGDGAAEVANSDGGLGERWGRFAERRKDRGIALNWPSPPGVPQHGWERARIVKFGVGAPVDGLPARLARYRNRRSLSGAGNAVVPQIVAALGAAILDAEGIL
jgi:DNA (cytosine-5)-methyltransferase 1